MGEPRAANGGGGGTEEDRGKALSDLVWGGRWEELEARRAPRAFIGRNDVPAGTAHRESEVLTVRNAEGLSILSLRRRASRKAVRRGTHCLSFSRQRPPSLGE